MYNLFFSFEFLILKSGKCKAESSTRNCKKNVQSLHQCNQHPLDKLVSGLTVLDYFLALYLFGFFHFLFLHHSFSVDSFRFA